MIKAIIFDAFGTLISTGSGSLDATKQLLRIKNYPDIDAKAFYSKWKAYHTDILRLSIIWNSSGLHCRTIIKVINIFFDKNNAVRAIDILACTVFYFI